MGVGDIHVVVFPINTRNYVRQYWQHYGDIISSRLAFDVLNDGISNATPNTKNDIHKQTLKNRIAGFTHESADNVYLYPSGIANSPTSNICIIVEYVTVCVFL